MTRKFQPHLQCIQLATGETLTKAAQIADRWKGYCKDLYHDERGKGTEQEYRSQVARDIRQTASRKPQVLMRSQQNCSKQEERQHSTECTEYCGDLGNWLVARAMDVLHVYPTSQER